MYYGHIYIELPSYVYLDWIDDKRRTQTLFNFRKNSKLIQLRFNHFIFSVTLINNNGNLVELSYTKYSWGIAIAIFAEKNT